MNEILEDKKYIVIRDVLPKTVTDLAKVYYITKFMVCKEGKTKVGKKIPSYPDAVQPWSAYMYSDTLAESLLFNLKDFVKEQTKIETICPTYSMTRFYEKGNYLEEHIDRPACQYSLTLPIGSWEETPWSIYLDGNAIDLNIGDVLLYKGCEATHWREPYEGEWQIQMHLHYIDESNPKFEPYKLDGRKSLGIIKEETP